MKIPKWLLPGTGQGTWRRPEEQAEDVVLVPFEYDGIKTLRPAYKNPHLRKAAKK